MADEPNAAPPEPIALDEPAVAAEVANPDIIPVADIIASVAGPPADPAVAAEGTLLTGDESPKGKVAIRTRYPVDRFDAEGVTVTASPSKVDGAKIGALVAAAKLAGTELERV